MDVEPHRCGMQHTCAVCMDIIARLGDMLPVQLDRHAVQLVDTFTHVDAFPYSCIHLTFIYAFTYVNTFTYIMHSPTSTCSPTSGEAHPKCPLPILEWESA